MKPFLILQLRSNDLAADNELDAFLRFGGLHLDEIHRVRMDQEDIPDIDLQDYSGVIVGGGPSDISTPEDQKPENQVRFEKQLFRLLDTIVEHDFPYLGACYGFGALVQHQGGVESKEMYGEDVGAIDITLTDDGQSDPLLAGLPTTFRAMCGHKEACQTLPKHAVWLASSATCPYQILRVKKNIYATQFHPELETDGICLRIDIYKDAGYFPPEDGERLKAMAKIESIRTPMDILARFIERYSRD